jgi:hypothetical protein
MQCPRPWEEPLRMSDDPIDALALWLHWTAHSTGQAGKLGELIRAAAREAHELHAGLAGVEDDDPADVPALMDRFLARWDECERLTGTEPNAPPGERPTDPWGFGRGTQAARINDLLAGDEFRTITEVYHEVAREFPTVTRARVNTHIQVLRQRHRASLQEQRNGRRVAFRLDPSATAAPALQVLSGHGRTH